MASNGLTVKINIMDGYKVKMLIRKCEEIRKENESLKECLTWIDEWGDCMSVKGKKMVKRCLKEINDE